MQMSRRAPKRGLASDKAPEHRLDRDTAAHRERRVEKVRGQEVSGPVKDFAFYTGFKGRSVEPFAGRSDMFSNDMHFCNI